MIAGLPIRWTRLAACAAVLVCSGASAQYQPPPPPLTTAPCVPTKKEPCVTSQPTAPAARADKKTDAFPFPGDDAPAATDPKSAFPFPEDTPVAPAPGSTKPADPKAAKPAPGDFPFPEDDSAGSTSSSSSSSSSGSADGKTDDKSDTPKLADEGSEGSTRASRRKLPKVESMADREAEDLNISKYYQSTGNFKGAYMRAQDAVKSMPDDSEAHFRLGETAEKMNKKDEAVAEFNAYLKMDPQGEHVKSAKRALEELK